jgi:serine/threonine protein kinase
MQQGQKSRSLMERLPAVWQTISKDYEFLKIQGQGSFGQVVKATQKSKNKTVAIKYIADAFENIHSVKRVYREIAILRRLSSMEDNIFTVKLLDVIIPEKDNKEENPEGIFLIMSHVN